MNNIENPNPATPPVDANQNAQEKRIKLPALITPKRAVWFVVVVGLVALAFIYKGLFIAATVDGKPISRFTLINELEKQSGREALNALITKALIENEAGKRNIDISTQQVDDELKKLEDQIAAEGGTLDDMLSSQGVSRKELRDQVVLQKQAESIVADQIQVTDEEVDQYIADSGQTLEEGSEAEQKAQIKEGLRQQKFSTAITAWLDENRKNATIKEFVTF